MGESIFEGGADTLDDTMMSCLCLLETRNFSYHRRNCIVNFIKFCKTQLVCEFLGT